MILGYILCIGLKTLDVTLHISQFFLHVFHVNTCNTYGHSVDKGCQHGGQFGPTAAVDGADVIRCVHFLKQRTDG